MCFWVNLDQFSSNHKINSFLSEWSFIVIFKNDYRAADPLKGNSFVRSEFFCAQKCANNAIKAGYFSKLCQIAFKT